MSHVAGVNSQLDLIKDAQPEQINEPVKEAPAVAPTQKVEAPATAANPVKSTPLENIKFGLDIGTMNIISSKANGNSVDSKRIRNVFIDLTSEQVKMLKLSGNTSYITKGDIVYVLGDDAAAIANIFGRQLKVTMEKGVIAPGSTEAMEILSVMVGEVLGKAPEGGGICTISSPADPVDGNFDALYHQSVVESIVSSYGWDVECVSESTAMAFSEGADSQFTGLFISWGAGMTNISLVFQTIETLKFSIARGGCWIDDSAAKVTGRTPSQICAIKEKGIDLMNPIGREQEAIAVYTKHLIAYVIKNFIQQFRKLQGNITLPAEIPCVIAGGTSYPKGFLQLVQEAINKEKGFPFPVSNVKQASDPLNSVSRGLLVMAQNR